MSGHGKDLMTDTKDEVVKNAEELEALSGPMTIGVEAYTSEAYARAERDRLWRKVWQQVGRVEEIPEVGNYLTYEILDDSIIVVRTGPSEFKAHHNVCMHRGRRLVDTPQGAKNACGRTKKSFVCGFMAGHTVWMAPAPISANRTTGRAR